MIGGSNRMLSAAEAADKLGINRETLYRKWDDWGLRGVYVGSRLKFRERDLEQWLSDREAGR